MRRVPVHLRATAVGGLAMFQDLALGATAPATGLFADSFGYDVVFLVGGAAAIVSFLLVLWLASEDREQLVV